MTNQYFWDRIAGRDPNLRAGDADRDRTAERLRESQAEGRLDIDEFQQRLERCYKAKTHGELGELVRDLPRQDELERPSSARLLVSRSRVLPLASILIALIVISAAVGHHHTLLWIPLVFLLWRMFWWPRRRPWAGERRGPRGWY